MPEMNFTGRVNPWPHIYHAFLPPDVIVDSEALRAAVDQLDAARAAAGACRAEANAACEADQAAARAAVATGKPVPAPTVPAAAAALAGAERAVEACEALAREAMWTFLATQTEHLSVTIANVRKRQAQIGEMLDARLDEIAAGLNEWMAVDHVLRELDGGALRHRRDPRFTPVPSRSRRPRDLGEEAVAPIRSTIAEHPPDNTPLKGRAA